MAFTKITTTELNSRGATTLPNVPTIPANDLKKEFDAPAKEIVAPKFNNLIDELEATTAASNIGVVPPTGRTGNNVKSVMDEISTDLAAVEGQAHFHLNKDLLDTYTQTEADLANAVADDHTHSNKALLDTYTQTEEDIADAISKEHTHSNKTEIDKFSETDGKLYYGEDQVGTIINAISKIKSGTHIVISDGADTVEFVAGTGMTIQADPDNNTITFTSTGGTGGGDMLKEVYDSNNDGIVNSADTLDGLTATVTELNVLDGVTGIASSVTSGDTNPVSGGAVYTKLVTDYYDKTTIDDMDKPFVKYGGSTTFVSLINNAATVLVAANENKFFRLTEAGSITTQTASLFAPGLPEGTHFPVDSHIAIINAGTAQTPDWRYDEFGGGVEGAEIYFDITDTATTYTFTHSAITANSVIDVYSNVVGDKFTNITVSSGSCVVTCPNSISRTVRIYVR